MSPRIFISYSHEDEIWKDRLVRHLGVLEGEGVLSLWDDRKIAGGDDWLSAIEKELASADAAVLLISAGFLLRKEVPALLGRRNKDGLRVIPLLVSSCAWQTVKWLAAMQIRPKDAKPLSGRRKHTIDKLLTELALEIRRTVSPPSTPVPRDAVNIDRLPTGGRHFVAREEELRRLDEAWDDDRVHAISIVAMGGIGKSALVDRWLTSLGQDGWRGARRVYGWSFYSQGTEERLTSADAFIDDALKGFGDPNPSFGSARDRGLRLAELVRRERTLLVLDGVEPLQHPPGPLAGRLKDPALAALVKSLARSNNGLLVISTREPIEDIANLEDTFAPRLDLEKLSDDDGAALLELLGVQGTLKERRKASSQYKGHALALSLLGTYLVKACGGEIRQLPEIDVDEAVAAQGGHAWRVIAAYERWLGEREVSVLRLLGLFDRPAEPEALAVLRAAPVVENLNDGLVGLDDRAWNVTLSNLRDCGLLIREDERCEAPSRAKRVRPPLPASQMDRAEAVAGERAGVRGQAPPPLDAHPLVRAYFGHQLENRHPSAWQAGHELLYEHYKNAAPERPDTLDEMMPLYAAVVHGCRAGKHKQAYDEVYRPRIRRENEHYQLRKLGAFGADLVAVGSFFVRPWDEVVAGLSDDDKAWLLNQAGFVLRALGRHLADVHLERTCLHLASGEDVRARERLDAAAELVGRCGYERRRPDLTFLQGVLRERS